MIEELFFIEKQAYHDSFMHRLDARVKILLAFSVIISMVAVPYSTMVYTVGAVFFCFFVLLWAASKISPVVYAKRLLAIVPLWGIIIVFQIFFKNRYYTNYTVLWSSCCRRQRSSRTCSRGQAGSGCPPRSLLRSV
jgi:cobalt/nickel transport system permease protein